MSDVPGPPLKRKRSLEERRQSTSSFLDIIVNKHQSDDDATSPQSESSDSTQNGNDNSRTSPPASNSQSNAPSETTSQYKPTDESTQQLSTSNQPSLQNQHKPSSTQNTSHSSHQPQHHHTHHNHTNAPRSGIEPSMFNSTPIGDTLNEVARMIFDYIDDENVEIEAKLGRIIDKRTGNRLALPALCETVIRTDMLDVRFDSAMTEAQHRHYNGMLNALVTERSKEQPPPVVYRHYKEIDYFYFLKPVGRVRVTKNQQTDQVIGCIQKYKVAEMEIYSPKTPLDFRITISTEKPAPDPSSDVKPERFRKKDRISYKHALMKVDLTQVKAGNCDPVTSAPILNGTPPVTVTHELEVEFVKPSVTLKREKDKQLRKEHNVYLDMVNSFLNTVRLLAKRSVEG